MARKVADSTVEIQSKGVGRLAPDLAAVGEKYASVVVDGEKKITFGYKVDVKNKKLILDAAPSTGSRLNFWRAGTQKYSGLVSMQGAMKALGINWEDKVGAMLEAKIKGTKIEIQF